MDSVIPRASADTKIVRSAIPKKIRDESEVSAAYAQVGKFPHNDVKSWYGDIYDFYQNNEC